MVLATLKRDSLPAIDTPTFAFKIGNAVSLEKTRPEMISPLNSGKYICESLFGLEVAFLSLNKLV